LKSNGLDGVVPIARERAEGAATGRSNLSPVRPVLIPRFSDHSANERTFLAWVRTGIATIAFGYVIEKFNLFMLTLAEANPAIGSEHHFSGKLSGALGRYDGTRSFLLRSPSSCSQSQDLSGPDG
jgi:Domain of unknown function (DUF202)